MASRKRSVEQIYPNKKAREVADAAVDSLPLDATMLEHLILWEETYLSCGGTIYL